MPFRNPAARVDEFAAFAIFTLGRSHGTEGGLPEQSPVPGSKPPKLLEDILTEAVAARSQWQVVGLYEEAGISGAKGRDRWPSLDRRQITLKDLATLKAKWRQFAG